MTNTIEHKVPAKIARLVHSGTPDYRIVSIAGTGVTEYWPSIDADGRPMSMIDHTIDEMLAAKCRRERLTVRLEIDGNAVMAEDMVRTVTGYDCLAISPGHVDVFVPLMLDRRSNRL